MTSYDGLCEILARDYQLAPENLTPETPLKSLEIDSLGIIELIFAIEEKFSVTANDADTGAAQDFATLADVAAYIDRLVAERDAAPASAAAVAPATAEATVNDTSP